MWRLRWLTLLWPGLPQLWFAGAWSGLTIAIGFAALLDLGLLSSRIWNELFPAEARSAAWLAIGVSWAAAGVVSFRWVARLTPFGQPAGQADLFELARVEYLKGHWFEAETALRRLLDRNVLDLQARLMLAGLLGRTGRGREATGELDRLFRTDGGEVWHLEIARWRARLTATTADSADEPTDQSGDEAPGTNSERDRVARAA